MDQKGFSIHGWSFLTWSAVMKATPSNKKCSVHKQIPSKLRGARTSQPVRNDSPTEKPLEPFIWATFEFACESGIPTPTNHGPFLKASFVWGSNEWTLGTAVTNAPCLPLSQCCSHHVRYRNLYTHKKLYNYTCQRATEAS